MIATRHVDFTRGRGRWTSSALACLLAVASSTAAVATPQTPPSSGATTTTAIEAPTLEAGEPWPLGIDDTTITAILRTEPIETGSPIVIEFFAPGPESVNGVTAPELPAPGTIFGNFEVLESPRRSNPETNDGPPPSRLALRTFDPGPQELPPIPISLDGVTIRTPARTLMVESVAGLDTDLEAHQDIAAAVEVPTPLPIWLWWAVAAGVVGFLALLVLLWWWRRRPRPVPPPEPADAWALAKLDRLASDDLLRDARIDPFFTRLTDIAREFVERRFGIAAPERTTPEFIRAARVDPGMESAHRDRVLRLGAVLGTADLVKFAGDRPARDVCEDALLQVRDLVIEIGPKPASDPDANDREHGATDDLDRSRRRSLDRAVDGIERLEAGE